MVTLKVTVYHKPIRMDEYLTFELHNPLEHKLSVIWTLSHRMTQLLLILKINKVKKNMLK